MVRLYLPLQKQMPLQDLIRQLQKEKFRNINLKPQEMKKEMRFRQEKWIASMV